MNSETPLHIIAERAVCAAGLENNEIIDDLRQVLKNDEFESEICRSVWVEMCRQRSHSNEVDYVTVASGVKTVSAFDLTGWRDLAIPSHAARHAEEIKKAALGRWLKRIGQSICEDLQAGEEPAAIEAKITNQLINRQNEKDPGRFEPCAVAMTAALKQVERAMSGELAGIRVGIRQFDRTIGGLQPGWLIIIAGRTGNGKTIFAIHLAVSAGREGHGVAFVSAEMSAQELAQRMLSTATGVENRNLRRGVITDTDATKLAHAAGSLSSLPLWFLDSDRSWVGIKSKIRTLKLREPKLALVIVDYVGLIKGTNFRERYREIGEISAEAKSLAMELKVTIVLISQLNRDADDRPPRLSDLRESGNLEQDSDLVSLLFQPSKFDSSQPKELFHLDVAKNRHGAIGAIELLFNEQTVSFSDWPNPANGGMQKAAGE